ncbi:MAG: hypothetical protein B6245_22890, partial [Desulfobacteraceae bacterium 4572_88]
DSGSLKIKKTLRPCLRASAALRENILSLAEPQRRREKKKPCSGLPEPVEDSLSQMIPAA